MAYQQERLTEALRLQNAARNSMAWFEHVKRYMGLEAEQFAYSLLTRSQRVSHENLRLRDSRVSRRRGTLVRRPKRGVNTRLRKSRCRRCSRRFDCAA